MAELVRWRPVSLHTPRHDDSILPIAEPAHLGTRELQATQTTGQVAAAHSVGERKAGADECPLLLVSQIEVTGR